MRSEELTFADAIPSCGYLQALQLPGDIVREVWS